MTKRVLKSDPLIGEVTTVEFEDDKMRITTTADVGSQIEDNKIERNASEFKHEIPGLGQKVAHIPPTVALYWLQTYGIDAWSADPEQRRAVLMLLNMSDWAHLRTNNWDLGMRPKTFFDMGGRNGD